MAFKNTATCKHNELKQTRSTTMQEFSGEACALSKQENKSLTGLAFTQLSPGADQIGPPYLHLHAYVAQCDERLPTEPEVASPNPTEDI